MTRAIIYVRQSLDRTGEGLAVERQRLACLELCKQRGWTVTDTISDNDTSATKGKRPGFTDLLGRVGRGEVDVIVTWAVDRLVRQLSQLQEVIGLCESTGVKMATVSGDIDLSTDAGRLVGRILASVAQGEVERKSARQKAANLKRAEDGKPHAGGPRAFGYTTLGEIVPAEADAVREAFERVIGGGSLRGIAKAWNEAGLLTGKARWGKHAGEPSLWTSPGVGEVLRNPRYAGLRVYRGVEYPAQWPAVVTEQTYRTVVAILGDPSRRPPPTYGIALLSTVATCGVCGATVHSGGGGRRGRDGQAASVRYRVYRCSENSGKHIARRADHIDNLVTTLVLGWAQRPDAAELIKQREEVDVPALVAERETVRRRRRQLAVEFAEDDTMPADALRAATERLSKRLTDLDAALVEAGKVSALVPLVTADDVEEAWEAMDVDRQRAVIGELMTVRLMSVGRGSRTFRPESVEIDWKV